MVTTEMNFQNRKFQPVDKNQGIYPWGCLRLDTKSYSAVLDQGRKQERAFLIPYPANERPRFKADEAAFQISV